MANSKRRCRHCRTYKRAETMRLVPAGAFCNDDCATAYAIENRPKGQKIQAKAHKERKKRNRENDHKWQTARTQAVFNQLIRLLDREQPCISCGRYVCGHIWDCGHFKTVGAYPQLRFEPLNAFKQGSNCNRPNERRQGNAASVADGFQRGIVERFGHAHLEWLGRYHPPKHYTCAELAELRAVFAAEVALLKKGLPPSRDWRALPQQQE